MGLALGCRLLGWDSRVVGTTSQDKPWHVGLVVNGSARVSFLFENALRLLADAVALLRRLGMEEISGRRLDADAVFDRYLLYDNEIWRPAYGTASAKSREIISAAGSLGLALDPTFSRKAFTTLVDYGESGRLRGRRALFWNTTIALIMPPCRRCSPNPSPCCPRGCGCIWINTSSLKGTWVPSGRQFWRRFSMWHPGAYRRCGDTGGGQ